jgi:hypothetical protein
MKEKARRKWKYHGIITEKELDLPE